MFFIKVSTFCEKYNCSLFLEKNPPQNQKNPKTPQNPQTNKKPSQNQSNPP